MERDRIARRVYVRDCAGSRSMDRPHKRWIDTMKECLKKTGLDVRQAKRMVQYRSEWRRFVRGNYIGHSPWDESLTLTRYHSCGLPQPYETLEGWNSICG